MNSFIPKKLLAFTIFFECLSRIALLFILFQIPNFANIAYKSQNTGFEFYFAKFFITIFLFIVFHFFAQKLSIYLGGAAKKKLRTYFQNKFLNTPPIQDRNQKGMPLQELSLHYMKSADLMEAWYSRFLPSIGIAAIIPCLILFTMFFIDKLTFIILFFTGILLPLFLFLIGKAAKQKSEEQWQSFSRLKAFFLESLQGYKTIKIFKKVKEREQNLKIAENEFSKKTLAVLKTAFISALVQEWAGSLSIALVAVSLALRLMNGSIDFGIAFLALLITPEFYKPIRQFGAAFHTAINAKTAWNSAETNNYPSMQNPQQCPADNPVLLPPQQSLIYITGPSGCGKTRMVLEMLGHIEPQNTKTKLFYNGDKNDIAWMPQNPIWFKGALLENLCPVKLRDFSEVCAALKKVNLEHFSERLNEQVLEYAANFSGGEKRRLALARIILLNRPVWILDEPFAGLDKASVQIIEKLLEKESETKSILCISHHLQT